MSSGERPAGDPLLLAALVALALNLRSPFTAVAPLLPEMQADLEINKTVAGLFTTIPVLCFGALAPAASRLIAATSVETAVLTTLFGALAGIAIRSAGGVTLALIGTVVIGASLTIGNIVALVIVARDFSRTRAAVTGWYTSALNVGPMLTAGLSQPIARVTGWKWSLATWSVLAAVALVLWEQVIRRRRKHAASGVPVENLVDSAPVVEVAHVLRRPVVWLLIVAFAAHLLIYYGLAAWLPEYLRTAAALSPTVAGLAAALLQLFALAGTIGVPVVLARTALSQPSVLMGIGLAWVASTAGLLVAPGVWPAWCMLAGFASGGGITVMFMLVMTAAVSLDDNRGISAAVQGTGYLLAAAGPVVLGMLAERTGSWSPGFGLLIAMGLIVGLTAAALTRCVPPSAA
jgi:MFS transporter, CP family, cyanate transporter